LSLSKQDLRKTILRQREGLSAGEVEHRSGRLFATFQANVAELLPSSYAAVALYFPIRGEVDTRPFLKYFLRQKKRVLFPKTDRATKSVQFFEVADFAELRSGVFGVAEPAPRPGQQPVAPDVLLVPGVAFSADCHRLGYGAGYYDRYAAELESSGRRAAVRFVGLAYEFQISDSVHHEPHDHPMDFVVSEEKIFRKVAE